MQNKSLGMAILACLEIVLFCTAASAQIVLQHVDVDAGYSLRAGQVLDVKACESICIREGFRMDSGASLRLEVIACATADVNEGTDADAIVVYPNPGMNQVTIRGTYFKSPLTIFDESGNPVLETVLVGTDPAVDVSRLRKGRYIFKTADFTVRFSKE